MWFCVGDAEHSLGNHSAQMGLVAVDETTGQLLGDRVILRIPAFLREGLGGLTTVTVPIRGLDHRRADLAWALEPDPAWLAARSRAPKPVKRGGTARSRCGSPGTSDTRRGTCTPPAGPGPPRRRGGPV
jgi:hypothetical protein